MQDALPTVRILWAAFAGSHLIFAVVGGFADVALELPPVVALVFPLLGVVNAAVAVFGVPLFMRQADYQQALLVRFAVCESIALFALLLQLAGYHLAGLGLAAFALLTHLSLMPTAERLTAWEVGRHG